MTSVYWRNLGIEEPWFEEQEKDARRRITFQENKEKYGVDDRETWALDSATGYWLYARVRRYYDLASETINLTFHKFKIDGIEKTQREWIEEILDLLEQYLKEGDNWDDSKLQRALKIYAEILPAMWW